MTANKPMTGEQLDELMTVAVNMQRDSEKAGDRPSAMFAYAVQVAVLELRKVRNDAAALAAENAGLKAFGDKLYSMHKGLETSGGGFHDEQSIPYQQAALDAAISAFEEIKTPETDASMAELRAQGVESFAESQKEYVRKNRDELDSMTRAAYCGSAVDAERFAAKLRKGVHS